MATTLTITDGTGTNLTATGTSTTLTINTALSAAVATDIVYSPTGKMSSTNMQDAIDELAGADFRSTGTPSNTVSTGLGGLHHHNIRVTGKSDLFIGHNSSTHTSNITAKKFTSIANSTYYIEPASGTKINELQANKITPITSGSTSGAASSIFAIPKVSNTQQSGFNASNTQAGVLGQMLFDDNYIYICTQAGSNGSAVWKRAAISTF